MNTLVLTSARWSLRLLVLLWLAVGLLLMTGCATQGPREASLEVWASCPPLPAPTVRNDNDAQTRRIAALEGWYTACREAALQPTRR